VITLSEPLVWRKSSRSGSAGDNCVEVATAPDGSCAVRDSKDREGPVLRLTSEQWRHFTAKLKS
jgi:hypothetical protein